jgi:predicted  nucleic acid-binding Zn-ribbon protein
MRKPKKTEIVSRHDLQREYDTLARERTDLEFRLVEIEEKLCKLAAQLRGAEKTPRYPNG